MCAGLARKLRFTSSAHHAELLRSLVSSSPPLATVLLATLDLTLDGVGGTAALSKAKMADACMRSASAQPTVLAATLKRDRATSTSPASNTSDDLIAAAQGFARACLPKRATKVRFSIANHALNVADLVSPH